MTDIYDLAIKVLAQCRQQGFTIATAESCTGGLIAATLTEVAGASDVFDRGFITYSNAAKVNHLHVSQDTLNRFGAVSSEVAKEMAEGALNQSGCFLAVSVTGIAGPGGSENKPEGRVCFGLAAKGRPTLTETVEFNAIGRSQVRRRTVAHALNLLLMAARI